MNKEDFLLATKEKDKELAAKTIEFINEKTSKHLNLTIENCFGYMLISFMKMQRIIRFD